METVYLGLLRVFILVAATLALLASAFLVISTLPDILTRTGITSTQPSRGTLAEFMAEQKPQDSGATTAEEVTADVPVDPDLSEAAANIRRYLRGQATGNWEQGLQSAANELPINIQAKYGVSVKTLTEELLASKGKPLSERRVAQLIQWHQRRFAADVEQQAQEQAAADIAFKFKLGAAFAALMLFVLIAFIFLFVRIERNLRRVHVVQADDYA